MKIALNEGILDIATIQTQLEMNERKKYLERHTYNVWRSKDGYYRTYIPDESKGRKLIKKSSQKAIEKAIIDYYKQEEKDNIRTLRNTYPEWLNYKSTSTNSSSYIRRIIVDWNKYYKNDKICDKPLESLTKIEVEKWINNTIKKYNMTRKMFNNMIIILKQTLEYAKDCEYINENVYERVKVPKNLFSHRQTKARSQVYTEEEENLIIEDMYQRFKNRPSSTSPLAVILNFYLGLRVGELVAIKSTDIEGDYLHVQREQVTTYDIDDKGNWQFDGYKIVDHCKTPESDRLVYIPQQAKELIEFINEINIINDELLEDYLFVKGNQVTHVDSIQAMLQNGCKKVGMPIKSSHKIRKTYISKLLDNGLNAEEVKRMVGHKDVTTTLNSYYFNRKTEKETNETIESILTNTDNIYFTKK